MLPTEATLFVDPDDVKCSATGSRQSMLPIFLLRPGLCAMKGCFQPHNGSGHGRCQIHETRHIQAQYGEQGVSEDMQPLMSVDTEVWIRELRTSERLDRIAEGPAVWKPKYKGARTRIPMTRSEPKGKGKGPMTGWCRRGLPRHPIAQDLLRPLSSRRKEQSRRGLKPGQGL